MDLRKLKKLIEMVEESGIAEIEITEGEERVRITRATPAPAYAPPTQVYMQPPTEPMMTPARSSTVGTPLARSVRPTSALLRKCGDSLLAGTSGTMPPRYTMRCTPARAACCPNTVAIWRSCSSKPCPADSECIR